MEVNQNELLDNMEKMLTSKLEAFQESQRDYSQAQFSRIQQSLSLNDGYTYRKRGNEEQHKVNVRVLDKLKEADVFLQDAARATTSEAVVSAQQKVTEGIDLLNHREKLIKLADSSDSGWRVVQEYEAHPLADDSDDEKKIFRAQVKADRKLKQEKRSRGNRYNPYQRSVFTPIRDSTSTLPPTRGTQSTPGWNQSMQGRKPGSCFRCGRPGHWRAECKAVMSDGGQVNKDSQISKITLYSLIESFKSIKEKTQREQIVVTPVGKLKSSLKHWEAAGASQYVLEVVEHGYKLPFRNIPSSECLRNNKSARENQIFVTGEIKSLLLKGCITEVQEIPYIVNPLTVAYGKSGKARLVLDCRHINLELFKYKCCFEDQSVAKQLFSTGDYLFSFDIRSAYHHIMIFHEHRTFLGFSWEYDGQLHFYVFNVLPFGISTAGFIFTKLLRVVVAKWRSLGFRTVLFLDDGLGGESTFSRALQTSDFMHQDLILFGFLVAEDKCHWLPCQCIVWLGYLWDTGKGIFMVTEERIQRTVNMLQDFIAKIREGKVIFPVRVVARLIGQLISMQPAIGSVVRLRSRSLYECVVSRASWEAPVKVSSSAFDEIIFWHENLRMLNGGKFGTDILKSTEQNHVQNTVYCDASGAGFAGFIDGKDDFPVVGCWSESESGLSSTWRELEAIHRVLNSSVSSLEGQSITVNTDNKNVVSVLKVGSRKPDLQVIAVNVYDVCKEHDISLIPKWIPRAENKEADFYSRCTDSDDWSVENDIFETLDKKWGPHTFDLFACSYNTKCKAFYSKYWCPGTSGINAMSFTWKDEIFWLVPPPRLGVQCIRKVQGEKCACTLILPVWKSAPFWPFIFPDGKKKSDSVNELLVFQPGKLTKRGRGKNGIFDGLSLKTCIDEEIQQSGTQHASFDELSSKMAYFLTLSKSNSTTIKYYSYFKKWVSFISSKGGSAIPASPIHVALYLTDLIDKQSPHSVISSTVYSIKWAHSLKNLSDPTDNMFVINLVESSKRTLSKPLKKKEPITTDVLITLCEKYTVCTDVLVIRDLTMILLAYSGFLRFDELSRLHCNDIQIYENHISVHIRKSKTDQYRQGNTIVISKGDTVASPYNMLKRYFQVTGLSVTDDVFLFKPCFRSKNISKLIYKNKPLSYTRARECLVSRLREVVGDSNIGLHSLRAGGATMAANAGVNDRCWKRHGRWKGENSKDGYVADSLERRLEVSKSLAL